MDVRRTNGLVVAVRLNGVLNTTRKLENKTEAFKESLIPAPKSFEFYKACGKTLEGVLRRHSISNSLF